MGEFQTPTFRYELVLVVRRLVFISDAKVGVLNSVRPPLRRKP